MLFSVKNDSSSSLMSFYIQSSSSTVFSSSFPYNFFKKPFNMYQQTTLRTEQKKTHFYKVKIGLSYEYG